MRVATSTLNTNLLNELSKLTAQQTRLSTQLATQSKVTKANDNPLAYSEITQLQSRARGMHSFRANLDRAQMVSDLSKTSLGLLDAAVKESVKAATLLNTSLDDKPTMQGNVRLLDTLIEQAILAVNTKNGKESLFAGSNFNTTAFNVARDVQGKTTLAIGGIRQDVGGIPPKLVKGNYYRIENVSGVDFTVAGAAKNEAGVVFEYTGEPIDWIPGSGASLTAVSANIKESNAKDLIVGRAYEITKLGTSSEFRNSGAPVNKVGAQFIYNGKLPANWNGAELAALVMDYENPIRSQDYEPYEFYRVNSGTAAAFDDNSVIPVITNVFQYNGTPITEENASAVKLASLVQEGNARDLVVGEFYQIVDSDGTFAGGGAPAGAQTGDVFEYDGTAVSTWGSAKLIPVNADDASFFFVGNPGPLVEGEYYQIRNTGGDNFANLSTPPNAGTVGTVFQYNGQAITFGAGIVSPLDASIDPGDLGAADIGEAFVVVGGNSTLTGGGAGLTAKPGTRFVYDGTGFQPADFGGATLTRLTEDPNAKALRQDKLYTIGHSSPAGSELPNLKQGDTLVAGKTYRIESISTASDFTGAFVEAAPYSVGDIVTATGAQPVTWDTAELKSLVLQTVEPITGELLEVGKSYQIASTTQAQSVSLGLKDTAFLMEGQQYTITHNGSDADFSSVGGSQAPNLGDIFTAAGVVPGSPVNFGDAILVEVDINGDPVSGQPIVEFIDPDTGNPTLTNGTRYQVVDNGSATDFTRSGATDNRVGTTFTYNGVQPEWGSASLNFNIPASDFTAVGAPNNAVGTSFTATNDWPEWGNGATLNFYRPEFSQEADLTDIGAARSEAGVTFNYNGNEPVFDNINGEGSVFFGYKREVLAVEYAGSKTNSEGYTIAENVKLSPYSQASDNARFADAINAMMQLRDAFQMAVDADTNDSAARFAAQQRLSEAGRLIDLTSEDVTIAIGNLEMNELALQTAANRDDALFKNFGDIVDKRKGIDTAQVMTQLNQSYNAYQTAIETGSQIGRTNLFDFI